MIDVMTRSKIHHLSQAGIIQAEISARCGVGVRTVQRVLTEPEPSAEDFSRGRIGSRRQGRPPKADEATVERIRLLHESQPTLPATEVLRLAREWGFEGGRSQTAALLKKLRPKPRAEPIVRFEGCLANTRSSTSASASCRSPPRAKSARSSSLGA